MAVRDVLLASALITSLAIGFFILHYVAGVAVDSITSHPEVNESPDAVAGFEASNTVTARLDYIILIVFMGLMLGIMITGWFVGGHPIFMFIYFIVLTIGVVLSAVFSNVWEDITQRPDFGTTILSFPLTNHLMTYLPVYIAILGIAGIIVMFARPAIQGGIEPYQ